MQQQNFWLLSYDLDTDAMKGASVTPQTIYNHVRQPWLTEGFKKLQNSVYQLEDGDDAIRAIQTAFMAMEENDVRRYISSMILKGPTGEQHNLLEILDRRQAERLESEKFLRGMLARIAAHGGQGG